MVWKGNRTPERSEWNPLNILAFTDFHGNLRACEKARQLITTKKPDFVIVAGDIINYDANRAKQFLRDLASGGRPVYFVLGNMDNVELKDWSEDENIRALHGRSERWENVTLVGLGGSPQGPFGLNEGKAAELLEKASKAVQSERLVLVSHCPPKNTKLDRVYSGEHVGSIAVRRFIEKTHPVLVVSGHIHEAQGVDLIGSTTLVNTGAAQRGNYAEITLNEKVNVTLAKLF